MNIDKMSIIHRDGFGGQLSQSVVTIYIALGVGSDAKSNQ